MSISGEIKSQVAGVIELSVEARNSVEAAAELIDSAVGHLTVLLAESRDPGAEQVVRSLMIVQERLAEVTALAGWVTGELPVFLDRLGQGVTVKGGDVPAVATSHGKTGRKVAYTGRRSGHDDPVLEERTYKAWWGWKHQDLDGASAAESAVRNASDRFFTHTIRGVAIRIGNGEREQAPLRISIDTAAGRAAVSWHGSPGIESGIEPGDPLIVEDDPRQPPLVVPAERARVTPAAAIRAAREYVETGRRPTCLDWNADTAVRRSEPAYAPRG